MLINSKYFLYLLLSLHLLIASIFLTNAKNFFLQLYSTSMSVFLQLKKPSYVVPTPSPLFQVISLLNN